MYKGDFPFQCCLWLLEVAAVWLGTLNPSIWQFVCLTTPRDGSQRVAAQCHQRRDCHTLCSSRGGCHTIDVSAVTCVTHVPYRCGYEVMWWICFPIWSLKTWAVKHSQKLILRSQSHINHCKTQRLAVQTSFQPLCISITGCLNRRPLILAGWGSVCGTLNIRVMEALDI